jgi:integrase
MRRSLYRKTRQEAARALMDALRDREHGIPALPKRQSVGEYLQRWLDTVKRHTVDSSSYVRYEVNVRVHLVPALGRLRLAQLNAQHIQAFYTGKLSAGYAPATVHNMHATLQNALAQALQLGLVARNVATMVTPPRVKRNEMAILSEEQARQLLRAVRGHRLESLIILALATGMREGELIALRWSDVDLDHATLRVRQTLHRALKGFVHDEAKTAHSRKTIALSTSVVSALRHHYRMQAEERLSLGPVWEESGLVFSNEAGGRLSLTLFRSRSWFGRLTRQANVPPIRFHNLRHTAATLLLARGVNPKVVSEMLGHANVGITLSLYGHVTPHMQHAAAETMERVLTGQLA